MSCMTNNVLYNIVMNFMNLSNDYGHFRKNAMNFPHHNIIISTIIYM